MGNKNRMNRNQWPSHSAFAVACLVRYTIEQSLSRHKVFDTNSLAKNIMCIKIAIHFEATSLKRSWD